MTSENRSPAPPPERTQSPRGPQESGGSTGRQEAGIGSPGLAGGPGAVGWAAPAAGRAARAGWNPGPSCPFQLPQAPDRRPSAGANSPRRPPAPALHLLPGAACGSRPHPHAPATSPVKLLGGPAAVRRRTESPGRGLESFWGQRKRDGRQNHRDASLCPWLLEQRAATWGRPAAGGGLGRRPPRPGSLTSGPLLGAPVGGARASGDGTEGRRPRSQGGDRHPSPGADAVSP